jgi:SAM-dependent methyltransferase
MSKVNQKCAICGNKLNNEHYTINEKMFLMQDQCFDYLLCSKCGTLQLNSVVSNMLEFYPKAYSCFTNIKKQKFYNKLRHYMISNFIIKTNAKLLYNEFNYLTCLLGLKIKKSSAILDLGCGSGSWLDKLSAIGFKNLTGVDLYNQRKINTNDKWTFISGDIFDIQKKFDIIILHHSFEHMNRPKEVLKKIRELLNKDGVCIIRIPVMGKNAWKKYKTNWAQIDAPRHLYLYTEKAMSYLGKKSGLKLSRIHYDSDEFQFWGSEVYANKNISLATAIRIKNTLFPKNVIQKYKEMANTLNKNRDGDQAIFYFKPL